MLYIWYICNFNGEQYLFVGMSINHSEVFSFKMFQLPRDMCCHVPTFDGKINEHTSAKKDANGAVFHRINS